MPNTNTELCHYGVKGMKWGIRKKDRNAFHKSEFRRLSTNADDHYVRAIKNFNKAVNSDVRKDVKLYKAMGVDQMHKAYFYEKQAKKQARKAKHTGSSVQLSERQKANRESAGKLFVKKSFARRTAEFTKTQVSIGLQYAVQTAILGRPIGAVATSYSEYKIRGSEFKKQRKARQDTSNS